MDIPFDIVTKNAQETQKLGEALGHSYLKGEGPVRVPAVICLWGELGSGKTTFTQGLAKGLGIRDRLLSPTFIIVRRYAIPERKGFLYHLDLYRIGKPSEAEGVGFSEMIRESGSLTVVEWPERLGTALPLPRLDVRFSVRDDGCHHILGEHHE